MPFWKCYYHIIWSTKHRQSIIQPIYESIIFASIHKKAEDFKIVIFAINGMEDHIHLCVSIPPSIAISEWIGSAKGASARAINTGFELDNRFHWQEGYGALTFGEKQLDFVVDYVNNQKIHHSNQTTLHKLEQIDN